MDSIVRKVGGSLYFHIPSTSAKALGVKEGDIWSIRLTPNDLTKRGEPEKQEGGK